MIFTAWKLHLNKPDLKKKLLEEIFVLVLDTESCIQETTKTLRVWGLLSPVRCIEGTGVPFPMRWQALDSQCKEPWCV